LSDVPGCANAEQFHFGHLHATGVERLRLGDDPAIMSVRFKLIPMEGLGLEAAPNAGTMMVWIISQFPVLNAATVASFEPSNVTILGSRSGASFAD